MLSCQDQLYLYHDLRGNKDNTTGFLFDKFKRPCQDVLKVELSSFWKKPGFWFLNIIEAIMVKYYEFSKEVIFRGTKSSEG